MMPLHGNASCVTAYYINNANYLQVGPLKTNFTTILIGIQMFLFLKKMLLL